MSPSDGTVVPASSPSGRCLADSHSTARANGHVEDHGSLGSSETARDGKRWLAVMRSRGAHLFISTKGSIVSCATTIRVLGIVLTAVLSVGMAASASAQPSATASGNSSNAKLCQKGGWMQLVTSDGAPFANQGECVSYAARGGTLVPKPTATPRERWRDICLSAGGTFTETTHGWSCESSVGLPLATRDALNVPCEDAGRLPLWSPFGPLFPAILCLEAPVFPPPPPPPPPPPLP